MPTVNELRNYVMAFVVVVILASIGGSILGGIQETNCPYTVVSNYINSTSVNPADSSYSGCCQTTNTTDSALNCTNWYTSVEINTTSSGLSGITTFGDWLVIIALVIVAVVVIGLLMKGFGGKEM